MFHALLIAPHHRWPDKVCFLKDGNAFSFQGTLNRIGQSAGRNLPGEL